MKPIHTSWTRPGKVLILSWLYCNLKAGTFIKAHIFSWDAQSVITSCKYSWERHVIWAVRNEIEKKATLIIRKLKVTIHKEIVGHRYFSNGALIYICKKRNCCPCSCLRRLNLLIHFKWIILKFIFIKLMSQFLLKWTCLGIVGKKWHLSFRKISKEIWICVNVLNDLNGRTKY